MLADRWRTEVLRTCWNRAALERRPASAPAPSCVNGGLVAFPTETVYGIAVSAPSCPDAVERLYELKGRPRNKAMSMMVADMRAGATQRCPDLSPKAHRA